MTLIDQGGKRVRLVCDRCHQRGVKFTRGEVCDGCRSVDRAASEHAKRFYQQAVALQVAMQRRRAG